MKKNWVILLIILIAFGLRFYKIDEAPYGFNADEAAIGYNIYSLLETGMDEHGNPWPIHFQSFNDYKPGGYFYLALPFVKIFGLSEFVVRLPSLLAGVMSIYFVYLLAKELLPGQGDFGEIMAFMLAISPWHIHFSRGAWETNVATFFLILGSWLFLKGVSNFRFKFVLGSSLAFVASAYVYHSTRLVAPLLLLVLISFSFKKFLLFKKKLFVFFLVSILVSLPLLVSLFSGGAMARFSGVGVTGDIGPLWNINRSRGEHESNPNGLMVRLLHNRPLAYSVKIFANWFSHFRSDFLFLAGDTISRSGAPGVGQFYYLDCFLFALGVYFIFKQKEKRFLFPFFWIFLAPLPAAITLQSPHALRSHSMMIPFLLVCAFGFYHLLVLARAKKRKILFGFLLGLVVVWQLAYFLNQYFVHYPFLEPWAWQGEIEALVHYIDSVKGKYSEIYVTDRSDQPYILYLFYTRYPPEKFQKSVVLTDRDKFGFSTVRDLENIHFEVIDWDRVRDKRGVLVIGTDEEIPDAVPKVKQIFFRNGKVAFEAAEL